MGEIAICAILDDVACNRHFQVGDPEEGYRSGLRAGVQGGAGEVDGEGGGGEGIRSC